jgi:ectoine hydroxylase-related dioxygenase (phytanoyl-CoA dioxygenase family)
MTPPAELAGDRVVTAAECQRYQQDGHIYLSALASPDEVAAYRTAILATAESQRWEHRHLDDRDTYGRAFLQMFNLWRHDPVVARFVLAPRFARVAAGLMGVEGVRIYHDQALVKEADGGHTPWHQDHGYWPVDTDDMITMWMPLADIGSEMGSMNFASGSHRLGNVAAGEIGDDSHESIGALLVEHGLHLVTHGAMAAGDATFHAGWTLHSAPANPTETDRPVMTVIYVADGARVTPPTSQQELDMGWLGGRQPGELIDSELNPLVWPA